MTSTHEVWGKLQTKANSYEIAVGEELACYLFCIIAQTASASNTTIGLCRQIVYWGTQYVRNYKSRGKLQDSLLRRPRVSSKLLPDADCCKWYILSAASFSHTMGGNISFGRKYSLETNVSLLPPPFSERSLPTATASALLESTKTYIQCTDYECFSLYHGPARGARLDE